MTAGQEGRHGAPLVRVRWHPRYAGGGECTAEVLAVHESGDLTCRRADDGRVWTLLRHEVDRGLAEVTA